MPITATCPGCKALFRLPEDLAGKQVRCQKCAQMFTVPMVLTGLSAPAIAAPAPMLPPAVAEEAPIPAAAYAPPPPKEEVILAPVAPEDEVVMATLAEPSVDNKPPLPNKPVRPEPIVSLARTMALLALFLVAVFGTGIFASIWIATHLSPPLPITAAGPLHLKGDFRFDNRKGNRVFMDKERDRDLGFKDKLPKPNPITIIVQFDADGKFEDERALTFNDPRNADGPFKTYHVELEAGQVYVFDMRSDAFTPRMELFDANDNRIQTSVAKAGNHSQMTHKAAKTGSYRIQAVANRGERGPYTLNIEQQANP